VAQKSITEMEHPHFSPDLAPNDLWLFSEIKFSLKGRIFQDTEDINKNKCDDGTERHSTTGIAKAFTTVAASLG
jgi:hypothetical protein